MDLVVTVPKTEWKAWLNEGCLPGEQPPAGTDHYWFSVPTWPRRVEPGDRVYVVSHARLRGYAPLCFVADDLLPSEPVTPRAKSRDAILVAPFYLVRAGGAVAVTIDEEIVGFRGFRYRWWARDLERPFDEWRDAAAA